MRESHQTVDHAINTAHPRDHSHRRGKHEHEAKNVKVEGVGQNATENLNEQQFKVRANPAAASHSNADTQ